MVSFAVLVILLGRLVEQDEDLRYRLGLMAIRDGLTGLYNHRHFYDVLQREISRAQRTGDQVGLLMIDLDKFKSVNDAHGHMAGDEVLSQVAGVIIGCIRIHDSAFRYGGEEFAVILPGASAAGVAKVAHRVCRAIAIHPFSYRAVTASVGWSQFPELASDPRQLVGQADRALYRAKEAGGNRALGYREATIPA